MALAREFWRMRLLKARRFRRDEEGGILIFSLFLFVAMLMVSGLAVDIMRVESSRALLQSTLDRAVLAAADMEQTLDPEDVVNDYFEKAGLEDFLVDVNVSEALTFRTVTASAEASMGTIFMHMLGVESLAAPASGTAEESVSELEISLVLDISGSMGWNSKMDNLQVAAKDFVDTVLEEAGEDMISLSVVPYTAQVNAGPALFNQFNVNQVHDYSHCIDFDQSDFDITGYVNGKTYTQMQHFEWSSSYYHSGQIGNPGCPQQNFERILAFSQDRDDLHDMIDDLRARANTAIHLGMKWGTLLLDPQIRPMVSNLVTSGNADSAFTDRPADWNDGQSAKFVVLMTDGENVTTYRIADWAYDSPSDRAHWARYPLWWWLNNRVSWYHHDYFYSTKYTSSQADDMLSNVCDAAKDAGITVYTVGFEVSNHSAGVMEDCASAPSYFFRVEGVEISSAFAAIARDIRQLKLTM